MREKERDARLWWKSIISENVEGVRPVKRWKERGVGFKWGAYVWGAYVWSVIYSPFGLRE